MIRTPLIPTPLVVAAIQENRPASILDIGCGFGRYGFLFREALDVSFQNNKSFIREGWTTKIDAVEVYPDRIGKLHNYIYDQIFVGDIIKIIDEDILGSYDIIFLGDVIEHLNKDDGWKLLNWAYVKANKMVIIATPSYFMNSPEFDEYDIHLSLWRPADFRKFSNRKILILENRVLCVFLVKENVKFSLPVFRRSRIVDSLGEILKKTRLGNGILNLIRIAKERYG